MTPFLTTSTPNQHLDSPKYKSLWINQKGEDPCFKFYVGLKEFLGSSVLNPNQVVVENHYSSLNYKDSLAVLQKAPILRTFPLIPGIDLVGQIVQSQSHRFQVGDWVLYTGRGMGEQFCGAYSSFTTLDDEYLLPLPQSFNPLQAMTLGTAGLTAIYAALQLDFHFKNKMENTPKQGRILITGASGGVGSVAVALFKSMGYEVWASSGKHLTQSTFLKNLGAEFVLPRLDFENGFLGKSEFDLVFDTIGGDTLAHALKRLQYRGAIATCGMAAGGELNTSVYPFILRGNALYGIDTAQSTLKQRLEAWPLLRQYLSDSILQQLLFKIIPLQEVPQTAQDMLDNQIFGRIVVDLKK